MYIYIYIYIHTYTHTHTHKYDAGAAAPPLPPMAPPNPCGVVWLWVASTLPVVWCGSGLGLLGVVAPFPECDVGRPCQGEPGRGIPWGGGGAVNREPGSETLLGSLRSFAGVSEGTVCSW